LIGWKVLAEFGPRSAAKVAQNPRKNKNSAAIMAALFNISK